MPRSYSLSDKNLIEKCAIRGQKTQSKYFIVKSLSADSKRFAIVVSKKVDKRASVRNKLRRQVKYCLSKNISNVKSGIYLIISKNNSSDIAYRELENDLLKNF